LLLFAVLYGFWVANLVAFDGAVIRDLAAQFLALAQKQKPAAVGPRMIGHRLMGMSLLCAGDTAPGRAHLDAAMELYDPAQHRPLATRFGQDSRAAILCYRSWALWMLGYPQAALADTDYALKDAREIGQAASLMNTLALTCVTHVFRGDYAAADAQCDEVVALAEEKGAILWKALGMMNRGCLLLLAGKPADAVQMSSAGIAAWRSTGATVLVPLHLSFLARAYAELRQFDEAWRAIDEAIAGIRTSKEMLFACEINRLAGEIALIAGEGDAAKAQGYFTRALDIARAQQARSWELRAAMSLARLWRDAGRRREARELLGPVYGWFTEGFDTRDLTDAKALLATLG
jgi:predicted ATPase